MFLGVQIYFQVPCDHRRSLTKFHKELHLQDRGSDLEGGRGGGGGRAGNDLLNIFLSFFKRMY